MNVFFDRKRKALSAAVIITGILLLLLTGCTVSPDGNGAGPSPDAGSDVARIERVELSDQEVRLLDGAGLNQYWVFKVTAPQEQVGTKLTFWMDQYVNGEKQNRFSQFATELMNETGQFMLVRINRLDTDEVKGNEADLWRMSFSQKGSMASYHFMEESRQGGYTANELQHEVDFPPGQPVTLIIQAESESSVMGIADTLFEGSFESIEKRHPQDYARLMENDVVYVLQMQWD